eukprot:c18621_g3_i1.p1 GENE.c18621_g3_i1~~c18621_g3_i1.p1  ORF type:complete len:295 (+),score=61.65 c18621_g3_i1:969-1853(+)
MWAVQNNHVTVAEHLFKHPELDMRIRAEVPVTLKLTIPSTPLSFSGINLASSIFVTGVNETDGANVPGELKLTGRLMLLNEPLPDARLTGQLQLVVKQFRSAYDFACEFGGEEVVELFELQFICSAERGDLQTLKYLHSLPSEEPRVNFQPEFMSHTTALISAATGGHVECVEFLLSLEGCDPNRKDDDGDCALLLAINNRHVEVARLLILHPTTDLYVKDKAGSNANDLAKQRGMVETDRLVTRVRTLKQLRPRMRAFLMGTHPRKRRRTVFKELDSDVVQLIAYEVFRDNEA